MFLTGDKSVFEYIITHVKNVPTHEIFLYDSLLSIKVLLLLLLLK